MLDIYRTKTEKLEVIFHEVENGLIFFTIKLGEQSFETNFSDVFDPLPNFRAWLEAICRGVPQCSFSCDPEGAEFKFDYRRVSYDTEIFTVSYAYTDNNDEPFVCGKVKGRQLVEEFYQRFLEFTESENFVRHFWEKIIFSDYLTELLEIDYENLIGKLTKLGRKQLSDWLFLADLRSRWNQARTKAEEKELAVILRKRLANAETTYFPEMDEKIIRCHIPSDYSSWTIERKTILIAECLSENCSPQYGTSIAKFRSAIIENYIASPRSK